MNWKITITQTTVNKMNLCDDQIDHDEYLRDIRVEANKLLDEYLTVDTVNRIDLYEAGDDSICLEINGNGIPINEAQLDAIVTHGVFILQERDMAKAEDQDTRRQWEE